MRHPKFLKRRRIQETAMTNRNDALQRFNVNTEGMRQLHADRNPEELIKELVQNAFDEEVSTCQIVVEKQVDGVLITVTDDGPGFADIADAYTLMGETSKRMDPEKRGRFNLGDKEVISVAVWARIETTGWTVEFPEKGGRKVNKNRRNQGTKISVLMPWEDSQKDRLVERLKNIRPPEQIQYLVNGETVNREKEISIQSAVLPTMLQSNPGEPMRPTRRKTDIHIMEPRQDTGWIYEMGIPIQPIDLPYDVDVMQKVPMPPNRDTVAESYLKDIYTHVLNAIYTDVPEEQFGATWVKTAMENSKVADEAVVTAMQKRYGEKVVTWSRDTNANMRAIDDGYQVLHPRTMSRDELKNMREKGGLQSSRELFGNERDNTQVFAANTPAKRDFTEWVKLLGRYAGKDVKPAFIHDTKTKIIASCKMNTSQPEMLFNTAYLDEEFFKGRGQKQVELIIHELGHSEMNGEMSHGPKWGEGCARVGSMIAMGMIEVQQAQKTARPPKGKS